MEYGNFLSYYVIPEWGQHYIGYYELKASLKKLAMIIKGNFLSIFKLADLVILVNTLSIAASLSLVMKNLKTLK